MKFSAIIVTYNEARYLRRCLESLGFCDEIKVVDLGSSDGSVDIARQCGADVMFHELVPVVEQVWPDVVPELRHEWVVRLDPDEVMSSELAEQIRELVPSLASDVAAVKMPYQYFFRGKPLATTMWGRTMRMSKLFHKDRVDIRPIVHKGITPKEGFRFYFLERENGNIVRHYWIDSFSELFQKHWRYVKQEGRDRYLNGERFSFVRWIDATARALVRNLFVLNGYRGGGTGVFLSFFYTGYIALCWLSLLHYQHFGRRESTLDSVG